MVKKHGAAGWAAVVLLLVCLGAGCASGTEEEGETIPFQEEQLYAAAYLGYQEMGDLDDYVQQYLDGNRPPVHYLSAGDFYLVIPRYSGMELSLYRCDFDTSEPILIYEDPDCQPFVLQCNVSDIFPDATIRLTYGEESVEFSPYISLRDGSVEIGPGCLLTAEDAGA